ncbi:acyl-carrier-protein] S-malonyltransferase [Streptomyces albospinus]|uniref:[acyl-carrier-protein] S-malonyltransferase n=1 Tax=Streptomyces albospinus TaxID=285515 RepID=A0ABQ2UM13_9ACTN|nr:ACP S-malonyltransferase [Streptomyces albospinus]GGU43718.1 acyl-carrier-protein] S-malonyltransferase [Streptomyces albospinus]
MSRPVVFQFSGQGSQYSRMGWSLYQAEPVFRRALDRLDAAAETELGESVLATLYAPGRGRGEPFDDIEFTHPAIVMVELALAETLIAYGIEPDLLLGASLGEFTAAVLAGVLDADVCLRLLVRQARALRDAPRGGMLAVLEDVALHQDLPLLRERTEVAARNYPGHFVVSGAEEDLVAVEDLLRARQVVCQRVPVGYAFHSRLMDAGEPLFRSVMAGTGLRPPRIPVVSCASAGEVARVTVDHLWRATRQPIAYAETLAALERRGPFQYLDLGPAGTLHNFARKGLAASSRSRSLPLLSPLGEDTRSLAAVRAAVAPRNRSHPVSKDGVMKVYGFPGQGSQAKGMGKDLFEEFPEQTALADSVLGYSIRELCVEDPRRELGRTQFTQPALFVVSALTWLRTRREDPEPPDYLVGHSLGEYAALFAAGSFDFETGLRLVTRRGELMSRAGGGRMAAVIGRDLATVERTLADHGLTGLDIANHNAPTQFVLAGPADEIDLAKPVFQGLGAHYVPLNVSAPFHSRYLRDTAEEFAAYLDGFTLRDPAVPVLANVHARPYGPGEVKQLLARQIASPVRWTDTVRYLMGKGDFAFEELGPGAVLRKLVTKIQAEAEPLTVEEPALQGPAVQEPAVQEPAVHETTVHEPAVHEPAVQAPAVEPAPPVAVAEAVDAARPAALGSDTFRERYGLRHACLAGSMYGGVSGADLLVRLAKAGGMGFFGTGGLTLDEVAAGLDTIRADLGADGAYGANLLHQHADPEREMALVDLFLRTGVRTVEASGFLRITPALVKYRLSGGRVLAKVSSTDMAAAFLAPAPRPLVQDLVDAGALTGQDAARYADLPLADDLCVETGSGWYDAAGSLTTLLPTVLRLRDAASGTGPRVHVGAAGGIGSPEAAAAAFLLGADFVLTGSINQCTPEAATSPAVKDLLQELDVHDVALAPAPEMFELGVRAQVVKRGVFLPARAGKLHELWRRHDSLADLDAPTRARIEERFLRGPLPAATTSAGGDPKRAMADAFRTYLDRGFRLAQRGEPGRTVDYLIYCGPAMGAFNSWVRGTVLEPWQARHADTVAEHLMAETAALLRERAARFTAV